MLQLLTAEGWRTILLFDNAHGQHDLHRYTGFGKQPAERFMEGTPRQVIPAAITFIVDYWEAILSQWTS